MPELPRSDHGMSGGEDSALVGCDVAEDDQGWWVELVIAFTDHVVRHRVGPYRDADKARVAAHHIGRAVGRDAPPPTGL